MPVTQVSEGSSHLKIYLTLFGYFEQMYFQKLGLFHARGKKDNLFIKYPGM